MKQNSKGFIVELIVYILAIIAFMIFLAFPFIGIALLSGSEQSETDYADSYGEQIRYEQMIN